MNHKGVLSLLIVLVVLFGLVLTCPDKVRHREAVVNKVNEALRADSIAGNANAFAMVSNAVVTKIIEVAADKMLTVDNYFVLSLGTIRYNGEKRVVTVGILNHVFCLFNSKDLDKIGSDAFGSDTSPC